MKPLASDEHGVFNLVLGVLSRPYDSGFVYGFGGMLQGSAMSTELGFPVTNLLVGGFVGRLPVEIAIA